MLAGRAVPAFQRVIPNKLAPAKAGVADFSEKITRQG
jgi:hypothetical protein